MRWFQIVELDVYQETLQRKYENTFPSLTWNYEAFLFSATVKEIVAYAESVRQSADTTVFKFSKPELLSFVIINFASKILKTSVSYQDVLSFDESLVIFDCFVDTLTSDVFSDEIARTFSVSENEMLSFIVEFLMSSVEDVFAQSASASLSMCGLRIVWGLSLIVRSKRLSNLLDIHTLVDKISAVLRQLAGRISADVFMKLPHLRNNTCNVVNKTAVEAALVAVFHQNEIYSLESAACVAKTPSAEIQWLEKALALIHEVGDPLLICGLRVKESIIGHAVKLMKTLGDVQALSRLHSVLTASILRKYKANPGIWHPVVTDIYELLRAATAGVDLNDNTVVTAECFVCMKTTWLLSFQRGDRDIFALLSAYVGSLNWRCFESLDTIHRTLVSVVNDIATGSRGNRIEYLLLVIPLLGLHFSACRLERVFLPHAVFGLVNYLVARLETPRSSEPTESLPCIEGIYLLLSSSAVVDSVADEAEFLAACYDVYSSRALFRHDGGAFGRRVSRRLIEILLHTQETQATLSQVKLIISTLNLLYYELHGLPFVLSGRQLSVP